MSSCVFKCHKAAKLILAAVQPNAARYRCIAMATCPTPPSLKLPVLSKSTVCSVRLSPCRAYRVKTPAILKGGRRWMMHVGDLNHNAVFLINIIIMIYQESDMFPLLGLVTSETRIIFFIFFFFRGPIRSDDQLPVPHIVPIFSTQRDPVFPS